MLLEMADGLTADGLSREKQFTFSLIRSEYLCVFYILIFDLEVIPIPIHLILIHAITRKYLFF